jgi:acyl-CoA thioesterase
MSQEPATERRGIVTLSAEDAANVCWRFEVEDRLCAGPRGKPFLFGGSALGVAIEAMQRSVGQPVIWVNAQYHSFAVPGMILTLTTEIGVAGRRLTQARLIGEADGTRIITVQATLGASIDRHDGQWTAAPATAPWRGCPVVRDHRVYQTGINTQFEFRLARGRYPDGHLLDGVRGDGRVSLWVRPVGGYRLDRPMLAIIADYVSVAICDATGFEIGANSLDNTVRFIGSCHDEWVLVDIEIDAIADGVAHGGLRIFSEHGALLATASTSLVVRGA